jgi:raffinose/stachyose/melibiose transport system permease protein
MKPRRPRIRFVDIVIFMTVAVLALIQIFPIVWIFLSSFKSPMEFIVNSAFALPRGLYLNNFITAWGNSRLPSYFLNSVIITSVSIVLIALLSSTAAFAIGMMKMKANNTLLTYFLAGVMIPIHVTLIPLFQIYNKLGLINTRIAIMLPCIGFAMPMAIYLFATFYKFVPKELLESSVIDGCSIYKVFTRIILPISKNTFITVLTLNLIFVWNDYIFALTFLSDSKRKTITLGLSDFIGAYGLVDWGATFAAIAISITPILIIYYLLNRGIIAGMTAGAVKE